jgi:hypothetical protein
LEFLEKKEIKLPLSLTTPSLSSEACANLFYGMEGSSDKERETSFALIYLRTWPSLSH